MALFGLLEEKVKYRVRIFDNGLHIMTAVIADKGQNYITLTVHRAVLGIMGEKTRLAFMINPEIKPFIFGRTMELNFDIRDAVQLGDLLDIAPDLVCEIEKKYKTINELRKRESSDVIDAEYKDITPLTDEKKPDEPAKTDSEENTEDERPIETIIKGTKDALTLADILIKIKRGKDIKEDKIENCFGICRKHSKLLYWLPKYLDINQEVHALVSQSMIIRTGIKPSYYKAQTDALIAEKTLSRPKTPEGWQMVVMVLGIIGLIVLGIALILRGGI